MEKRHLFKIAVTLFISSAVTSTASFAQDVETPKFLDQNRQVIEDIDQRLAYERHEQAIIGQEINIIRSYLNSKNFDWTLFYYHRLNNAKASGANILAAGVGTHIVTHYALWQKYFKMADKQSAKALLLREHARNFDGISRPVMRVGFILLVASALTEMSLEKVNGTNKAALVKSLDRLSPEDRIRLLDLKIETFYLNTDTIVKLVENKKNLEVAPSAMTQNVVDRTYKFDE